MVEEFDGLYVTDSKTINLFRTTELIKNKTDEIWWLSVSESIKKHIQDVTRHKKCTEGITTEMGINRYILSIKGELSNKGKYGYEGEYDREVKVTEIINVKKICEDENYF